MRTPKNKFDIESLNGITKEEVILYQDELLEWLEDINWPIANRVYEVLTPFVLDIETGILKILKSDECEFQCNIVRLLMNSDKGISPKMVIELKRLSETTHFSDLKEVCEEALEK